MGVDEHILKRLKSGPSIDEDMLAPLPFNKQETMKVKPRPTFDNAKELRSEIRRLTTSVDELLKVFSKAHDDIKAEPANDLAKTMEKLLEQNEEIARALLLLLELHREHLPQISKHTRLSSQMQFRRPPAQMLSERIGKK